MPKKKKKKGKPEVHNDLSGFDIRINAFGEIRSSLDVEKLNSFLDGKVTDKKLAEHPDYTDEEE